MDKPDHVAVLRGIAESIDDADGDIARIEFGCEAAKTFRAALAAAIDALTSPPKAAVVDAAMIERALDARPWGDLDPSVKQVIDESVEQVLDEYDTHLVMRAALEAALSIPPDAGGVVLSTTANELRDLIGKYWDIAYREGAEGRVEDTEDCAAAITLYEIERRLRDISTRPGVDAELIAAAKQVADTDLHEWGKDTFLYPVEEAHIGRLRSALVALSASAPEGR